MSEGAGHGIVKWAEGHPYQLAGGIFCIGVIIVLLVMPKKQAAVQQTASYSGYDPGYNASVVAANASMANAQLAGQIHSADTQAMLNAHLADNDTSVALATLGLQAGQIVATKDLGLAANAAATAVDLANIQANVDNTKGATAFAMAQTIADTTRYTTASNNDTSLGLASIAADRDMMLAGINTDATTKQFAISANLQGHLADNDLTATLNGQNIAGQVAINGQNQTALTTMHGQDTSLAGLLDTNQTNLGIANINAGVETTRINVAGQVATTQANVNGAVAINASNMADNANARAAAVKSQQITSDFLTDNHQFDSNWLLASHAQLSGAGVQPLVPTTHVQK